MGFKILSTGSYLPEKILTNHDLEKMVETTDEWIKTRTGIDTRHIAAPGQATSDLGAEAAARALARAGTGADEIDALITTTITGDHPFPSTACLIQEKIGARRAFAFDLAAACSGFLYGLVVGRSLILAGHARKVLLIAGETMSRIVDYTDRRTCVLLGDGAAAALLVEDERDAMLGAFMASDGAYRDLLYVPAGGSRLPASAETVRDGLHFMKMEGQALFRVAVQAMTEASRKAMEKAGVTAADLAVVIPHQANLRIINAVVRNLAVPEEKVLININKYGNMSAASIAVGLDEAMSSGRAGPGDKVLLFSFGAGLTWAATVLEL